MRFAGSGRSSAAWLKNAAPKKKQKLTANL
jgi:hypothetical protein